MSRDPRTRRPNPESKPDPSPATPVTTSVTQLFMFDPTRPPPPLVSTSMITPTVPMGQSNLPAQFMNNYVAQFLVTTGIPVPPPPPGVVMRQPSACFVPPYFVPPQLPSNRQSPLFEYNQRGTVSTRPSSSFAAASSSTQGHIPRNSGSTQNEWTSSGRRDNRGGSFQRNRLPDRARDHYSTSERSRSPVRDRRPDYRDWDRDDRQRRSMSSSTNRKQDDGRSRDGTSAIRDHRKPAIAAERRVPASYRREKPSTSTQTKTRDPYDDLEDWASDVSSETSENQAQEQAGAERVPMSNLDFDGVGSDVSDTEEEDNPLGATDADAGKWIQCAPAKLYFDQDSKASNIYRATERLASLQNEFEQKVLKSSQHGRLAQPQLEPPAVKPLIHKCCHHGHDDHSNDDTESSDSDSRSGSEEGEGDGESGRKKKRHQRKDKRHGSKATCSKRHRYASGSSSDASDCSSLSNSDMEHERFRLAIEEMNRKQGHPARLHSELWFNEVGQMNDGPLCRCSWKARQTGIAHSIYPGEKEIPQCDVQSNNLDRLYHYRVVISPLENIKTKIATRIHHDGHAFQFEGFSILSHDPLPPNLPVCRVIRWNIEYSIMFSKEDPPELFTIRDLDLLWDYLFVELLELYDVELKPQNSSSACPIFHVLPRFVRSLDEGGQEVLPTCYVLKYFLSNYRMLIDDAALVNLASWPQEKWDKVVEQTKDQIVTNPSKRPTALRVDSLDRMIDGGNFVSQTTDNYPIIVHFGVRPAVLTYTGNPEYQKAWKQYVKFRHLLMMKSKLTTEDRAKLAQKEMHLQKLKARASLKRDVTVEISSRGFYTTGIYTDVVQHALMLLVAFCHIRFHWSLRCFEDDRIGFKFKNRALLELAFTHPSYRQNYGTNPDHARNTLSNCGIRQPEYGNKRMQQILSRKRGINTLIDIMSRMGSKKVKQSQVTNNERLEYLGDAVIEFLSTIHLFFMFPDLQEGGLATYRASLVQNKHLAVLAKKLGMDDFMLYAHGPDLCHEADLKHAMANAFEAVMGALFLDGGVDVADRVFGEALFRLEDDHRLHQVWFNCPKHPLQQQEPEGDRHWINQVAVLHKLTEFENQTGIHFKHIRLLARAFTRKNVGYNFLTLGHNQRLEFLGDTVLQLITSEYLYKHFPEHHEGHLSLLRSCLVNNKTQSVICDDLGMTKYVVHPPAFLKTGPPELRMKDKADLVESFLGALYVDRGLQFCKVFCKVCFYPRLKYFIMSQKWNDPKSQLQQCCLTLRNPDGGEPDIPTYKVISVEGPTNTRLYKVAVYFKGQRLAAGGGHSVQEAEMKAAEEALKRRADLFPHLEKQRYFIEHRFRKELGGMNNRGQRNSKPNENGDDFNSGRQQSYKRTKP